TATDACGNAKTCTQVITWTVDSTPPTITFCPANKTNECTGALAFGPAPTAADPCGAVTVTVLTTVTNATCGKTFVATRTWKLTDPCGNSITCSQIIATVDTTPPIFT